MGLEKKSVQRKVSVLLFRKKQITSFDIKQYAFLNDEKNELS